MMRPSRIYIAAVGGGGDTVAPTLTPAPVSVDGPTTAKGRVATDEAGGNIYWVVTVSATAPSVGQIQAAENSAGASAVDSGTFTNVPVPGTAVLNASGLSADTSYYFHFQHQDAAGNDSAVVTSVQFTTDLGPLAPAGMAQGQSIGGVTLSQGYAVAPAGLGQGQNVDGTGLTQSQSVAPQDLGQAQAVAASGLTQAHVIVPAGVLQSVGIDSPALTQSHLVTPGDVRQSQALDTSALTQAHLLAPGDISQPMALDEALLTVAGSISPRGMTQAQLLESLTLIQKQSLAPAGTTQAQRLAVSGLAGSTPGVSIQDLQQAQVIDSAGLTQYHVLSPNSMTQAQLLQVVGEGGVVIGELQGQIFVYAAIGGKIVAIPALAGSIH